MLSLVAVGFALVPPYLLKVLIDSVILSQTHPEALFIELTVVLVLSYALSNLVNAFQSFAMGKAGNKILLDLRGKVFTRVMRLSPKAIEEISTSRIESRLTSDTGYIQWVMTWGLGIAITNAFTIIGIGIILFSIFPALALYILVPIPIIIWLIISYNKRADRAYHRSFRKRADITTKVFDVVPNYLTVKAATKEGAEQKDFEGNLNENYKSQMDVTKVEIKYWQPVGFLTALATILIWWIGGNQVIAGISQLGVITAFLAYMSMFYSPIQQLSNIMPNLQESIASSQRIRELFNPEYDEEMVTKSREPKLGDYIEFKNVWFGYDSLFPILKDISIKIPKGRKTAIVGKSGSGKTTMLKLILNLYKIDKGDIRFGKESIRRIDTNHLRKNIAYVPQDATFFENSIRYNISYYLPTEPKPLQIIAAAKAAELHDEIMKFPLKYDNRVRGMGVNLSGGQRQRLSIARVLLSDSKIVLLDEITASLDAINARKVNKAIMKIEKGKTVVIVAHDVTEIMDSDYAILLEDGKVAEQGAPQKLIRKKGKLFKMFKYRFGTTKTYNVKQKADIQSFTKHIAYNEQDVTITRGPRKSIVDAKLGSRTMKGLEPKTPFPISHPEFIILTSKKGKEIAALQDYTKLSKGSKEALERSLSVSNFNPNVTSIRDIKITGDGLSWKLSTDKGNMQVLTRNRQDITTDGDNVILIDEFNIPLKIDTTKLNPKSLDLLEKSI